MRGGLKIRYMKLVDPEGGKMTYPDGGVYQGDWFNNKRQGYGTMRYANGQIYEGNWENDAPTRPMPAPTPVPDPIDDAYHIDPNQVHKFTSNINFANLIAFLERHTVEKDHVIPVDFRNQPAPHMFKEIIKGFMKVLITMNPETISDRTKDFNSVMEQRLNDVNYNEVSPELLTAVYLSLKYALFQTNTFRETYVQSYLDDTCMAHGDDKTIDNMSCIAGALERFITSLSPAATAALLSDGANEKQKQEYEQLVVMITRNPKTLIPNLIRQWQISHRNGINFKDIVGREGRRADLETYINQNNTIKELIKEEEETDENSKNEKTIAELIEELIVNYADSIGYENSDFYLGGRRTRKRRRRTKKMTKTKKKKPRKLKR